uniref:TRAF3-interacting protein 1 n=1 Tax=Anthurium amnicola TaxID=1678845 RepID=A0A1D1YJC7_9ARAE
MSRCFPFPPPGYEKKPRSDLEDLLIKENHKEKKHRKDKKDKEKREGKERKDREKNKDRSKDKHREKKDKKEKHRNKDKKKHNYRDKDKKRISNERKGEEHTNGDNERKLGEDSSKAECLKDPKFLGELGGSIRNGESGSDSRMGGITGKVQGTCQSMGSSAEMEGSTGNKMVPNITIPEQRRRMGMASAMEYMGTEYGTPQNSICDEQRRDNGMCRPMVVDADRKIEAEDKTQDQEDDYGKGNGHKDRVREKMHKEKNRDKDKKKEKEKEKIREKGERKHKGQNKLREVDKKEQVYAQNLGSLVTPKEDQKSACADGGLKRKEINGFLHENEVRCNKLSRAASSQLLLENGSKLDQSHIGSPCASGGCEAVNTVVGSILSKANKVNGMTTVQPPSAVLEAPENGKSFKKPPHPDQKHLSQILHLPRMEEWSEFDDQEWLLNRDSVRQKPETKPEADECLQVWASALRIESADVLALPYVIPY